MVVLLDLVLGSLWGVGQRGSEVCYQEPGCQRRGCGQDGVDIEENYHCHGGEVGGDGCVERGPRGAVIPVRWELVPKGECGGGHNGYGYDASGNGYEEGYVSCDLCEPLKVIYRCGKDQHEERYGEDVVHEYGEDFGFQSLVFLSGCVAG